MTPGILCAFFLGLNSMELQAQTSKKVIRQIEKLEELGKTSIEQRDLAGAEGTYLEILQLDSQHVEALTKLGAIYFQQGDISQSKNYYEKALTLGANHSGISYQLGEICWQLKDYRNASRYFSEFLESNSRNPSMRGVAEKKQRDATFRLNQKKSSSSVVAVPLPATINTSSFEYLPAIPATGDFMVFTRRVQGQEDFFISEFENGAWAQSRPISDLNTYENEGAHCVSADGSLLVFTACGRKDGVGSCDLYFSTRQDQGWSKPRNLGSQVNSKAWDGQPSFSPDGRTLYFSSSRPGGAGGRDIYTIRRTADGWAVPVNLEIINTKDDEESPFIHPDNQTLYFMSTGHPGFGGSDLFLSRKQGSSWTEPVNMGPEINTEGNEGAIHIDIGGSTGYFAREKMADGGQERDIDIYQYPIPTDKRPTPATYAQINVLDATTKELIIATVDVFNLTDSLPFTRARTNAEGELLICIAKGKDYAINIDKRGYLPYSENINLEGQGSILKPHPIEAYLRPISEERLEAADEVFVLRNIFFETGSAELLDKSFFELDKLVDLLEATPKLGLEIQGHTDNIGTPGANQELSLGRAKSVYDFLVSSGVSADRLTYKGYGETEPIASNDTEQGRQQNRRTAFKVRSNE